MLLNEIFGLSRAERDEKKRNKAKADFRLKRQGRERTSQRAKGNDVIDHGAKKELMRQQGIGEAVLPFGKAAREEKASAAAKQQYKDKVAARERSKMRKRGGPMDNGSERKPMGRDGDKRDVAAWRNGSK